MEPALKLWLYENWIADQKDDHELSKHYCYLLASFWNPEAVKQLVDDSNKHISSDADVEESMRLVANPDQFFAKFTDTPLPSATDKPASNKKHRKRHKLVNNA